MALFEGNDTHYGTHGEPSRKPGTLKWIIQPTAETRRGRITIEMWKGHVDGKKPIGVVPIMQDNSARWGSIDYDVYGEDLTALIKKVEAAKLPLVPCRSKSGGLHLFFFTLVPIPAATMAQILRNLAAALGIADSEIFPKQGEIQADRGESGSWMVMPYFGGDFGGKLKMQVGLRANGGEIGLPEFVRFAEKMRQSAETAEELMHVSAAPVSGKRGKSVNGTGVKGDKGPMPADDPSKPFGDGPPCLTHMVLSGGVTTGQNNALCHMATYYKRKFPDTWREELAVSNATHLNPVGSDAGLDSVIKSYSKKDYEYKCKDEPMRTHCDSVACRAKRFGVTGGTMAPLITSIKKLDSDPPIWFVQIDGKHSLECATQDLQRWDRFQVKLIEKAHNPYGMIPQALWLATIGVALAAMTKDDTIPVGVDAGIGGEFKELISTFLTNKQRATREEDLLSERPWEDEEGGRFYFHLGKLQAFLKKQGMEGMKRAQIVARIREDFKGGHEVRKVKDHDEHLYWIPSDGIRSKPKLTTPELKEKPI